MIQIYSAKFFSRFRIIFAFFCLVSFAVSVFLPCRVEATQFGNGDEPFKHDLCFFMGDDYFLLNNISGSFAPVFQVFSQFKDSIDKSRPEISSGLVKFLSFNQVDGVIVSFVDKFSGKIICDRPSDENAKDSPQHTNDTGIHFPAPFSLLWLCIVVPFGILLAFVGCKLVDYHFDSHNG